MQFKPHPRLWINTGYVKDTIGLSAILDWHGGCICLTLQLLCWNLVIDVDMTKNFESQS